MKIMLGGGAQPFPKPVEHTAETLLIELDRLKTCHGTYFSFQLHSQWNKIWSDTIRNDQFMLEETLMQHLRANKTTRYYPAADVYIINFVHLYDFLSRNTRASKLRALLS